jgi:hypothetical protein
MNLAVSAPGTVLPVSGQKIFFFRTRAACNDLKEGQLTRFDAGSATAI